MAINRRDEGGVAEDYPATPPSVETARCGANDNSKTGYPSRVACLAGYGMVKRDFRFCRNRA